MNHIDYFNRFAPVLKSAQLPVDQDPRLLMDRQDDIAIYYAPFGYINRAARVVLVGITPGPTQMVNSCVAARDALLRGASTEEAMREAKATGGFSGQVMRNNLVAQLNNWGMHQWLGLTDSRELFGSARHLLQTTSLLRYPVFIAGEEYGGTPDMTNHPLLRGYLLEHFAAEVAQMPDAVFLSLGPAVRRVLQALVREGVLKADQVETGMLHPSPNNTYRITYMLSNRGKPVPYRTNPAAYDAGRQKFRSRFLGGASV